MRLKPLHGAKLGEDEDSEGDREGDTRDVVGVLELCKQGEEPKGLEVFPDAHVQILCGPVVEVFPNGLDGLAGEPPSLGGVRVLRLAEVGGIHSLVGWRRLG